MDGGMINRGSAPVKTVWREKWCHTLVLRSVPQRFAKAERSRPIGSSELVSNSADDVSLLRGVGSTMK
jgi:hypothetical protein